MKTDVNKIEATVTKTARIPTGKIEIPITTSNDTLMIKRLKKALRCQELSKSLEPEDRFTIKIPSILILQIVEAYDKKSKAMKRKDKALDRMSGENDDLRWLLWNLSNETQALLKVAGELRDIVINNRCDVPLEQMCYFGRVINDVDDLFSTEPLPECLDAEDEEEEEPEDEE